MRLKNRNDAATQLAGRLAAYRGQNPLVLGVPRGAVPMAQTIAEALGGELDVVLVRKLRAPGGTVCRIVRREHAAFSGRRAG
ncbi:MAG TPA: phosphoribosyltransferase family protein [Vicinamibacterales bacterium]|nr:phosphoribosyltransferase family protein [Vicinamibacterales bacterium]